MIDGGYVDRVLITNFDPLISRACALVNSFPAVYDFAASHIFNPDQVSEKAIFHLHGQRDGFVLLNTRSEVTKHRNHIKPVFDDAHKGRVWIVVGYSGENDPVFDGYVVKITGDSIVFKETQQDRLGKSFTREVTKKITTPAV